MKQREIVILHFFPCLPNRWAVDSAMRRNFFLAWQIDGAKLMMDSRKIVIFSVFSILFVAFSWNFFLLALRKFIIKIISCNVFSTDFKVKFTRLLMLLCQVKFEEILFFLFSWCLWCSLSLTNRSNNIKITVTWYRETLCKTSSYKEKRFNFLFIKVDTHKARGKKFRLKPRGYFYQEAHLKKN